MLKLCTLMDQINLFLFHVDYLLTVIVLFIALNILTPEIVRTLQHFIDILLFIDQVKPELVLVVGATR